MILKVNIIMGFFFLDYWCYQLFKKVCICVLYIFIICKYFGINEVDIYIDLNMKFIYIFMIFYDRYYVIDDIVDCNYNFFRNGSFC